MGAMNALGAKNQLGKRQREQRADLLARPVVADGFRSGDGRRGGFKIRS